MEAPPAPLPVAAVAEDGYDWDVYVYPELAIVLRCRSPHPNMWARLDEDGVQVSTGPHHTSLPYTNIHGFTHWTGPPGPGRLLLQGEGGRPLMSFPAPAAFCRAAVQVHDMARTERLGGDAMDLAAVAKRHWPSAAEGAPKGETD